jgi:hypothetical protein
MRTDPWPEMPSKLQPERTLREILDYLVWIAREMRNLGFHSGSDREEWCRRCQQAYVAFFVPMMRGFGDPYPPDVPPARNPGIWPDIPSAAIPGMTLRHQLTVIEMMARQLRERRWLHARGEEVDEWDRRLCSAQAALDHGGTPAMPDSARSEASPEALAEAKQAAKALQDRARRRSRQLRQQFELTRAARSKRGARKAGKKKAAAKGPAPTGRTTPATKKATKKKAAKKKAAKKKSTKKRAAKKKAAKKKSTKKKAAPKKAPRKTARKK